MFAAAAAGADDGRQIWLAWTSQGRSSSCSAYTSQSPTPHTSTCSGCVSTLQSSTPFISHECASDTKRETYIKMPDAGACLLLQVPHCAIQSYPPVTSVTLSAALLDDHTHTGLLINASEHWYYKMRTGSISVKQPCCVTKPGWQAANGAPVVPAVCVVDPCRSAPASASAPVADAAAAAADVSHSTERPGGHVTQPCYPCLGDNTVA
jgi:hypothetical protein